MGAAIACAFQRHALTAALAARIGPGIVIVPAYTFMATAAAVLSVGAIPVVAEIDETMTLDTDGLRKDHKGHQVRHPGSYSGFPCNMARLMELKEKYGFYVVETPACRRRQLPRQTPGTIGDCGARLTTSRSYRPERRRMVTNDIDLYQRHHLP